MVFLGVHMFLCLEARKMQRRRFRALGGERKWRGSISAHKQCRLGTGAEVVYEANNRLSYT